MNCWTVFGHPAFGFAWLFFPLSLCFKISLPKVHTVRLMQRDSLTSLLSETGLLCALPSQQFLPLLFLHCYFIIKHIIISSMTWLFFSVQWHVRYLLWCCFECLSLTEMVIFDLCTSAMVVSQKQRRIVCSLVKLPLFRSVCHRPQNQFVVCLSLLHWILPRCLFKGEKLHQKFHFRCSTDPISHSEKQIWFET